MPLFTIITVVYNAEKMLEGTIQSVLQQICTDYEYIIIDGKSSDGTTAIVHKYKSKIDKYISEPDGGIYDAMNKGLGIAEGNWVYFLNAGDRFANNSVLSTVAADSLYNEQAIVCGRVILKDNTKNTTLNQHYPRFRVANQNYRRLFASAFCHQALFIPREAYIKVGGFNLHFKTFSDFNSVVNLLKKGYKVYYIDTVIAEYDINGGSANWKFAKRNYYEKEEMLALAGHKKSFLLRVAGIIKLELFILRKTLYHARFK